MSSAGTSLRSSTYSTSWMSMRSMYSVSRRSKDSETLRVTRGPVKSAGCPGPYFPTCNQTHRLADPTTGGSSSSSACGLPKRTLVRHSGQLPLGCQPGSHLHQAHWFLLYWACLTWQRGRPYLCCHEDLMPWQLLQGAPKQLHSSTDQELQYWPYLQAVVTSHMMVHLWHA